MPSSAPQRSRFFRPKASAGTSPSGSATRPARGRRWMWLVVGGVGFVVATVAAFVQPPRDNPLVPTQSLAQWFKEPVEVNGWRRLPYFGQLDQIFFEDKVHGWALSGNAILTTTDGGFNWKIQYS